eukprot:6420-Heterococcus_DN1.PRE.2
MHMLYHTVHAILRRSGRMCQECALLEHCYYCCCTSYCCCSVALLDITAAAAAAADARVHSSDHACVLTSHAYVRPAVDRVQRWRSAATSLLLDTTTVAAVQCITGLLLPQWTADVWQQVSLSTIIRDVYDQGQQRAFSCQGLAEVERAAESFCHSACAHPSAHAACFPAVS